MSNSNACALRSQREGFHGLGSVCSLGLIIGLGATNALAQPDPVIPNPFGTCNNAANAACDVVLNNCTAPAVCEACGQMRYISFEVPDTSAGSNTAIRVKLTSLHHPPNTSFPHPHFEIFEGQNHYLNTIPGTLSRCCDPLSSPTRCDPLVACSADADCVGLGVNTKCEKNLCPDSTAFSTFFRCARIGCSAEYRDWSDFSGLITYANGHLIVPNSVYHVSHLSDACAGNEASCAQASAEIQVRTETWGNCDCSNVNGGYPSASDIGRVVDKVRDVPGAFIKPRAQMREAVTDPSALVTAQDLGRSVDSVKGIIRYPFYYECFSVCTSNAQCMPATCTQVSIVPRHCTTPRSCVTDADCNGLAATHVCSDNGFCTMPQWIEPCTGMCQP